MVNDRNNAQEIDTAAMTTTEAAVEVMGRYGVQIYQQITARVVGRCREYVRQKMEIGAVLFNGAGHLLALDGAAEKIIRELKG